MDAQICQGLAYRHPIKEVIKIYLSLAKALDKKSLPLKIFFSKCDQIYRKLRT